VRSVLGQGIVSGRFKGLRLSVFSSPNRFRDPFWDAAL
jgi:hypothetical protein